MFFQVIPAVNSGQCLIDDALKMISGCIIPSLAITNSGSLSTTYLGSVLMSGSNMTASSSTDLLPDIPQSCSLTTAFAATLFPDSTVFRSCFRHQNVSFDSTLCQSATLTFSAGNLFTLFGLIIAVLR